MLSRALRLARWPGARSLRLGDAGGLTQFGANLVILQPGAKSSLRHWHRNEDEFVMVTEGELVLVQDEGEYVMRPGDCAGFPAGDRNGHCLDQPHRPARRASSSSAARRRDEVATYSDVDLVLDGRRTARPASPTATARRSRRA